MKFKKVLFLLMFVFSLLKPTLAVTTSTKEVKNSTKITKTRKHRFSKKNKVAAHKIAHKRDYMHGIASYYGKGDHFNGRLMANGQVFNTYDMFVAAHPTLPLGTKLKVINNRNGKVAYVEIKDRMPRGRRVIDLSYAAAGEIGMQRRGLSNVTLVRIDNSEFYKQKHLLQEARNSSNSNQS